MRASHQRKYPTMTCGPRHKNSKGALGGITQQPTFKDAFSSLSSSLPLIVFERTAAAASPSQRGEAADMSRGPNDGVRLHSAPDSDLSPAAEGRVVVAVSARFMHLLWNISETRYFIATFKK